MRTIAAGGRALLRGLRHTQPFGVSRTRAATRSAGAVERATRTGAVERTSRPGAGEPIHAQTQWAAPPAQAQWGAPAAPQQWQAAPPPLGQSPTSHAAPPAARQSSLHWLVIGPIIIAALQAATFYGGVKYYESSVKSPEQVHEVAMRIALASMTLPYLFGGWLIAYRSVGRTILLAAVAAVLSVGVMYLIVPYTGLDLKLDRDGLLGASIIGFVCAFVGAVIGEFTPGHR